MSGEILRITAAASGEERQDLADGGDFTHPAAEHGEPRRTAAVYSVAEAATEVGVPVRTLRDWITRGEVRTLAPTPPQRGRQVPGSEVERLRRAAEIQAPTHTPETADGGEARRQEAAPDGESVRTAVEDDQGRQAASTPVDTGEALNALQAITDLEAERSRAAVLADEVQRLKVELARVQATSEEKARHDAERQTEVEFLRSQLEERATSERELRVLLLRTQEQVQVLQEAQKPALPAGAEQEKVRPWWRFW